MKMNSHSAQYLALLVIILLKICGIYTVTYSNWEKLVNASNQFKGDYFSIEKLVKITNISEECENSISHTLESLKNLEDWSFQMYNSWGKFPPSGIVEGTVTDFGDYDQCLSITPNQVIGKSQYCLIDISLPVQKPLKNHHNFFHQINVLPEYVNKSGNSIFVKLSKDASFFYWFFIRRGICAPNKCSISDIRNLAEKSLNNYGLILKDVNCESKRDLKFDSIQIIAILLLTTFVFSNTLVTVLVQTSNMKKNSKYIHILEAFDFTNNLKKLLSTKTDQEISCINGMRVMTILWVIFGHTIEWTYWGIYRKTFEMKHILSAPKNQPLLQAYYSVETFFFISGLLTMYITMKHTEGRNDQFSKIGYIISRFIRLTPQLAIFILLTTLIPLLGSGPVWNQHITPIVNNCYTNWWQNLLYLQTFFDTKDMCGMHTWYIATDMQFHWISLIVIIALHKNIKFGLIINTLIIIGFIAMSAIIICINDFPPAHIFTTRSDFMLNDIIWNDFFKQFFWKPWPHGSVYFTGLVFGYVVYKIRPKVLTNFKKIMIWILLLIGYIIIIFDSLFWAHGESYNRWISAFLYPFNRFIWATNLATLIWMCITGNGGFVNRFLSGKAFIPLSRLTYSVYLTHAWIVWIYWGSKRGLVDMNSFTILSLISGVLLMSYFLGAIFSLLFESPFLKLQSYLKRYFLDKKNSNQNFYISPLSMGETKVSKL